jgi:hypothetical protein
MRGFEKHILFLLLGLVLGNGRVRGVFSLCRVHPGDREDRGNFVEAKWHRAGTAVALRQRQSAKTSYSFNQPFQTWREQGESTYADDEDDDDCCCCCSRCSTILRDQYPGSPGLPLCSPVWAWFDCAVLVSCWAWGVEAGCSAGVLALCHTCF